MDIMSSDAAVIDHDEVWGVNAAGAVIRCDVSFAMDDYLTCVNRTPAFARFFETADHPVFTSTPRNPRAIAYPLQEVLNMPGARPYFNGSVSYIAAYAALIGVEELTIFGCDYIWGGVKYHPRQSDVVTRYMACMTYWLGYCQGRGMNVIVTPASPLLDADLKILEQFYGYIVKPFVQMDEPAPVPPKHLGGSFDRCHIDQGALDCMLEAFDIKSMIDIGCGTGEMMVVAHDKGLDGFGIDGDDTVARKCPVMIHDYTTGACEIPTDASQSVFDLAWSVEFLEHVAEDFQDHYMKTFQACRYAIVTAAPVGTDGHHHVNCQGQTYWIGVFEKYGFRFLEEHTRAVRGRSTMGRDFMRANGMVFENLKWSENGNHVC
tara:strand:- start:3594 stop:4721 length:1128 start_codon:yes stop_codon:yes gene_type:complete